jgi:hypothetical protein
VAVSIARYAFANEALDSILRRVQQLHPGMVVSSQAYSVWEEVSHHLLISFLCDGVPAKLQRHRVYYY